MLNGSKTAIHYMDTSDENLSRSLKFLCINFLMLKTLPRNFADCSKVGSDSCALSFFKRYHRKCYYYLNSCVSGRTAISLKTVICN